MKTGEPGFIGDYPSAIWYLNNPQQVAAFAEQLPLMQVEADYRNLTRLLMKVKLIRMR